VTRVPGSMPRTCSAFESANRSSWSALDDEMCFAGRDHDLVCSLCE
jgi:hypothetical protein